MFSVTHLSWSFSSDPQHKILYIYFCYLSLLHPNSIYTDFPPFFLEIFQAHLLDGRASAGASVDSARQNLAATFVNAFVNAGFGQVKGVQLMY